MNCDWILEFDEKLGKYPEIRNLKRDEFHGNITINFCAGKPMNYNLSLHRRIENDKP